MKYKHFLNCRDIEEVKASYKKLVKVHHPDAGGSHNSFTELKNEYDYILEGRSIFPIRNLPNMPNINLEDIGYEVKNTPKETVTNLSPEEIQNLRAKNYYDTLRRTDVTFDQIDAVVAQGGLTRAAKLWVYQEIKKLDDLTIDHFKYLTWILKDHVSDAQMHFKMYRVAKTM